MPAPFDPERIARTLYWCGWRVQQISDVLEIARSTVQSWKDRQKWDEDSPLTQAEMTTAMRYNMLVMKDQKTGQDFKEIDLLGRQMAQMARIRRYDAPGGHEGDLNEKVGNRNAGPKKQKSPPNLISKESIDKLKAALERGMYVFQETWWNAQSERIRMLLKSRQIGATYHFAHERLLRALETGNNQIFISASRNQANIFRQYIIEWVQKETGIKLKGDPLVIERGEDEDGQALEPVTLYFLGTNYRTAQGYHGDVIIDECFWIYGFEQLYKVASAMATQKRYTITLFSTPSSITHEAYNLWSGERFNKRRQKADRVKIDISHKALKRGVRCADNIWRQIVTLDDAVASGYDLIDAESLQLEYGVSEFENLFRCMFIDDSESAFPMQLIHPAMIDTWEVWRDFEPYNARPYGDGEVWLGYDPNEGGGDDAGLVAVAPPNGPKGKFRVLEKKKLTGLDFEAQNRVIKEWARRYRVTEISIDGTGTGAAVYQLVSKWFPTARRIDYSPMVKTLMVQKAQNVFRNRRIEFDAGWTDLAMALMSIHPQLTAGQKQMTYVARRSAETGHGDLAWALLHVLYCEPLETADGGSKKSTLEIMG
ncbi:terminase large subunit domain-containing protein [Asticcacaulis solisilvae]|uniref:terminase large subunit domain-containing protein n=1 Tax=Asticcacaulis solisilvae TaxID=1217274 RepID=UPI003FD8291E